MANTEKRNCRVEDWQGNIYYFDSNLGGFNPKSADSTEADNTPGSTSSVTTDGSKGSDGEACNGSSITITAAAATTYKNLMTASFSGCPFGLISVGIRAKFADYDNTNIQDADNILKVCCYYYDPSANNGNGMAVLLSTTLFTKASFGTSAYTDLAFTTNYKIPSGYTYTGTGVLKIVCEVCPHSQTPTLFMDYMCAQKAFAAIGGTNTTFA